jgi:hypothetical protein
MVIFWERKNTCSLEQEQLLLFREEPIVCAERSSGCFLGVGLSSLEG